MMSEVCISTSELSFDFLALRLYHFTWTFLPFHVLTFSSTHAQPSSLFLKHFSMDSFTVPHRFVVSCHSICNINYF